MKNKIEYIQREIKVLLTGMLLLGNVMSFGQFQTTIGFPDPSNEKSPGGLIALTGEYIVLGDNNNHPNGLYGIPDGDLQINWLDNSGTFTRQSRMYGQFYFDEAAWIEKAFWCNGSDAYVIASSTRKMMMLTMIDVNGFLIWSQSIGSLTSNYELKSACVKMDANGNFILVGTRTDLTTGQQAIVAVQVDCNGNQVWNRVYILNGFDASASSVTAFDTSPGGQGTYYITGKITPATGDDQVFILNIGTLSGGFNFWTRYDHAPNSDDVGTCIQGSNAPSPNGGLWVSGYSDDINANKTSLLFRTDLNGNPVWVNNYDIIGGNEYANHFQFAANGKIVMTGRASEKATLQGPNQGDCKLMRLDAANGNTIDFIRMFFGNGFSSQGNRVEVTSVDEYFITGMNVDLISPTQSSTNILALKTDSKGFTDTTCYYDATAQIIPRVPVVININPASITIDIVPDYNPIAVDTLDFNDQQKFCSFPPTDCDFTWTAKNCFEIEFTGTSVTSAGGIYTFEWDFDCGGPLPPVITNVAQNSNTISHIFPCGGGVFNVCLKITDPFGTQCSVMHTVTVPSTCCGQIDTTTISCTPDTNTYAFSIIYHNPGGIGGVSSCNYALTSSSGTIIPSSLNYNPIGGTPGGVVISGLIFVPNIIPLNLNFNVQTNCICTTTGLPVTCNLSVSIPTICCKEIHLDDKIVCKYSATDSVPIQVSVWPPLNQVFFVNWYITPKPPSGICPPPPYTLYQSTAVTNTLTPLQLYPNQLPGDMCVYAEVHLNDGPCTILTSNIAMVQLCTPDSCMLNDYDYCYSGTCIVPGLLTYSPVTHQDACAYTIEWFEPGNPNPVQTGGLTYQPTLCLNMSNILNCFEDFYFTAVITDSCGTRSCQSRIRLYSDNASPGTLIIDPTEPQFFCPGEDATLKYTPGCAGNPPMWNWYSRPCLGGAPTLIPDAGTTNMVYNTNELSQSVWYSVVSQNGVCTADTVDLTIEVKDLLTITAFSAVSDPCVVQFVTLTLDFLPCTIAGCNTNCNCTYTIDWYKDGFVIATTTAVPPTATFTYTTLPLYGNYYAALKSDCCPDEVQVSQVITFDQACEPTVLGPCFICDNKPVVLAAEMVMPPNMPCPSFCTLTWFDAIGNFLGNNQTITVTTGGFYTLQSDCNGCIKSVQFYLQPCQSGSLVPPVSCGRVSIEEFPEKYSEVKIFPNPTTGEITIEWKDGAPRDTRMFITDQMGHRLRSITVPTGEKILTTIVDDIPSGLYYVKIQSADRLFTVARLVKE